MPQKWSTCGKRAANRLRLPDDFLCPLLGAFLELGNTDKHSVMVDRHRARFILSRVRVIATLFAVLTPLWIPLDILMFPRAVWQLLALGRLVVGIALAALAVWSRHPASLKRAYAALATLFFLPLLFFLFAQVILRGAPAKSVDATEVYAFLPFVLAGGLSIFPLTVLELTGLALPLLAVASLPVIEKPVFLTPAFNAVGALWLLVLVTGVCGLSAVSQLQVLLTLLAQSTHDPVTGALNRGSGTELMEWQLMMARRHGYPLSLVFMDLDDFKSINDTVGHARGDQLLAETARAWRKALRNGDAILRWGGEEFIVLLPHASCAQAEDLVRRRLPTLARPDGTPLTYSVGIAEYSADDLTHWESLVALADQRMYEAKASGKARIVGCTPHPEDSVPQPFGTVAPYSHPGRPK